MQCRLDFNSGSEGFATACVCGNPEQPTVALHVFAIAPQRDDYRENASTINPLITARLIAARTISRFSFRSIDVMRSVGVIAL